MTEEPEIGSIAKHFSKVKIHGSIAPNATGYWIS